MLRHRRGILALCVLALLAVPAPGTGWEAARASPPPPSGDWTVTEPTSISSTTITLAGNLTIMPGGILTLDRVVLQVKSGNAGQYCITVRAGGEFHLRQSNLTAFNLSHGFGFIALPGSLLEMTGSEVHGAGAKWVEPPGACGLLVRTPSATFANTRFSQNIVALDVRNCAPSVTGCTFSGNKASLVAYNTSMAFRDSTVDNSTFGGLLLYDRANITITGSRFDQITRSAVHASRSSIRLDRCAFTNNSMAVLSEDSARLTIQNCTSTSDSTAISTVDCPAVLLDNVTVMSASQKALQVHSSKATAYNCTLESGLYDILLEAASSVGLVNCTFTRHNLKFQDNQSLVNISWFLGATVRWWSSGAPVDGAAITVTNGTGNLTATGTTSPQGRFQWAVAPECTLGITSSVRYGPYNVTARKSGLTRTVGTPVNRSLELDLLLDNIGPAIRVDFPAPGAFLNLTRVQLEGIAWDNETDVASVECRVDNGTFVAATGTSFWEFTTGVLINGPHNVTVRGRDTSNNTNQVTVPFTLDTIAPALAITAPLEGGYTRNQNVTVAGTTEKNATVTVNGTPVNLTAVGGAFNLTVELSEGDNFIRVVATDRAQNRAVRTVRFRRDTIVTPIEISPPNATWTNLTEIYLSGRVEENSTMLVRAQDPASNFTTNETRLNVTTGNFSVKVALRNGANLFRIDILDGYGNNATTYLTIFQDRTAPTLNVTSPSSHEYSTRERRLMLVGRIEPGASLYLNGRTLLVEGGNFSKALTLDMGENIMNLTAVDAAGNSVTEVYTVVLDRTPPALAVTSPKAMPADRMFRTDRGTLTVRGTTEQGASVYITVNGDGIDGGKLVAVDPSGGFRRDIRLKVGYNVVEVTAFDLANNSRVVHRVVEYVPVPPLISVVQWAYIILVFAIAAGFVSVIAWDTKRTTGRWGLKRPAWFRIPGYMKQRARAIGAFVPRPEFGREEVEAGIGAVPAEPRKQAREPGAAGAPAAPEAQWDAGPKPATEAPPVPPVPQVGKEFSISEKPSGAPASRPIPGATELPVPEPAGGAPASATHAAPPAPGQPAGPAPARPPAAPQPPPPEPPKPKEVDPLAEILGAPTRKP